MCADASYFLFADESAFYLSQARLEKSETKYLYFQVGAWGTGEGRKKVFFRAEFTQLIDWRAYLPVHLTLISFPIRASARDELSSR